MLILLKFYKVTNLSNDYDIIRWRFNTKAYYKDFTKGTGYEYESL